MTFSTGLKQVGAGAAAATAILGLAWAVVLAGHDYLELPDRIGGVEVRVTDHDESFKQQTVFNGNLVQTLDELKTAALVDKAKERAKVALCRKLVREGKVNPRDCPDEIEP